MTIEIKSASAQPFSPQNALELSQDLLNSLDYKLGEPALKNLDSPMLLKNIDQAAHRIIQAIDKREKITLITDHDCDGQSSCAVLTWTLRHIFHYENFDYLMSHRTQEGYGITPGLLKRLFSEKELPSLIITADCGISSHESIAKLHSKHIDVIVTDHHSIPTEGVPPKAFCVINPQQQGCLYPDKSIAGCFVAWLVMAATRKVYIETRNVQLPSMGQCLDFVTVGTISDCMDLKRSLNNRIVIRHGLKLIRQQSKPVWRALLSRHHSYPSCEFLSFKLIPLLNADGRLADALTSVRYLTSSDLIEAQHQLALLIDRNEQRKILTAKQVDLVLEKTSFDKAVIVNLGEQGHCGIHGITASKICQEQQIPALIFSQSFESGMISGSARSPENISLKNILDTINERHPDLISQYGGHHQAAGVTLKSIHFDEFKKAFIDIISTQKPLEKSSTLSIHSIVQGKQILKPQFWLDFESYLEPFGKEFEKPLFALHGFVQEGKLIGEQKNHVQLTIDHLGEQIKALFFFQKQSQSLLTQLLHQNVLLIGHFNYDIFHRKQTLTIYLNAVYNPQSHRLYLSDSSYKTIEPIDTKMTADS